MERVVTGSDRMVFPLFRANGLGSWIGMFVDTLGGVWKSYFIRTRAESRCRDSVVRSRRIRDHRTLSVNGETGGTRDHVVNIARGEPLHLAVEGHRECPDSCGHFYFQARLGSPDSFTATWIPGVGLSCFDFMDHDSAHGIWNGLGGYYDILGSSRVKNKIIPNPASKPGEFFSIPGWATENLPPGTTVTFQGFQSDPTAKKGFSVTNAIILTIE
jgi:hypothetical protein